MYKKDRGLFYSDKPFRFTSNGPVPLIPEKKKESEDAVEGSFLIISIIVVVLMSYLVTTVL